MTPRPGIPQVVSILSTRKDGSISVSKGLRGRLQIADGVVHVAANDEVVVNSKLFPGSVPVELVKGRLHLPAEALHMLGIDGAAHVALIQRGTWDRKHESAWAVKRVEAEERPGRRAAVEDWESAAVLTRLLYTNPSPDELLAELEEGADPSRLTEGARRYLVGRESIEAWEARRLLGSTDPGDESLCVGLIDERLAEQDQDGSWGGELPLTARRLRELATLGLDQEHGAVRRGAEWLLDRPASLANPGMWFLTDHLVAEQARILESRRQGKGGRFRERRRGEMSLYVRGDALASEPCGPRIMWPTGLVLEALLALDYEEHRRVQTALDFLSGGGWCECGYQHGTTDWRRERPAPDWYEDRWMEGFRTGGLGSAEALLKSSLAVTVGPRLERLAHRREGDVDVYTLAMPSHGQHCETLTVRGVAGARHPRMRRVAEAYLWHFASLQNEADGGMCGRDSARFFWSPEAALLDLFARYDHPASRIAILKAKPWIERAQNSDGSWGEGEHKDVVTLAVARALARVVPAPAAG